ncbi:MAG: nucleoside-diphosphate sugar epimerase/dehydratase [Legionellaceae bacterium]|nr:nucleoside-diphosphate sugar epimerase/dehydratase [Legionellaceae bacterium]
MNIGSMSLPYAIRALGLLSLSQIISYYYFEVYRGLWWFSSLSDVRRVLQAVLLATLISGLIFYFTSLNEGLPRAILPLYTIMLVGLLTGGRFILRVLREYTARQADEFQEKRVLIIGAGQAGEGLLRDLIRVGAYNPVGLLDDNLRKHGMNIHGVRVLGAIRDVHQIVVDKQVELIFIAIPSARPIAMRRIVSLCEKAQVPFRTLPGLETIASGKVEMHALREVKIEDLLGRDQLQLEWAKLSLTLHNKRIIVTGGGGSIGSELCRQIMCLLPEKLLIIDHSEFNLYSIEQELLKKYQKEQFEIVLLSVTDRARISSLFFEFQPHIIFHAAAYKHVPMLEQQARTAVLNNILGTQIVAEASAAVAAEKFVLISTDKAVNPTNVMGATKRVSEIFCQNFNEQVKTQFITVRFGNVLGSAGSVLPLFQKQIQEGGPVTVTHPDIIRYFMTIPEACQLILQAMVSGTGGEIFVLDMGEPVKIRYLAEQMIKLAGKEVGKDIKIEYTGLRPGEKLYEELFHETEFLEFTGHEKLMKARFRQLNWAYIMEQVDLLHIACMQSGREDILAVLQRLVPEFQGTEVAKVVVSERVADLELL